MKLNPVLWLDLRIRSREQRLWIIAVFFTATLLVVTGIVLATIAFQDSDYTAPGSVGEGLIWATLVIHAGLLVILGPLAAAGRIASEREQRTWAALANSPLARARIALGKLLGSWIFVLWLGCIALPFLCVGSLWGGPSITVVARMFISNLAIGITLASLALGFSGLFGRSLTAYLAVGAFLFAWFIVTPLFGVLLMSAFHAPPGSLAYSLVSYMSFFHHPLFPLMVAVSGEESRAFSGSSFSLVYCYSCWALLNLVGFLMAVRGLKRELY